MSVSDIVSVSVAVSVPISVYASASVTVSGAVYVSVCFPVYIPSVSVSYFCICVCFCVCMRGVYCVSTFTTLGSHSDPETSGRLQQGLKDYFVYTYKHINTKYTNTHISVYTDIYLYG